MEVAVDDTHIRLGSDFTFLGLYFQPFDNIGRMSKFDPTVLPDDSFNVLFKFDVISIDDGSFGLPPLRTYVGFVTLGSIGAWTLASLRFDIIVLRMFGLRIINISYSQSDSPHPYNRILFKLESLGLVGLFWIFAHDVP